VEAPVKALEFVCNLVKLSPSDFYLADLTASVSLPIHFLIFCCEVVFIPVEKFSHLLLEVMPLLTSSPNLIEPSETICKTTETRKKVGSRLSITAQDIKLVIFLSRTFVR